eukprot:415834_1
MTATYIKSNELLAFDNHDALCLFNYDTHLASSIHNDTQNKDALSICSTTSDCWIGLTKIGKNTFTWLDHSNFNYEQNVTTNSDPLTIDTQCVSINSNGWNALSCNESLYAICNYPSP